MTDVIEVDLTALWAAQDHAYALIDAARHVVGNALAVVDPHFGRVALDLGQPTKIQPDHVWISGEVPDWTREPDSTDHDVEVFRFRVHVYCERATSEYLKVRDRTRAMTSAVLKELAPDRWLGAGGGAIFTARVRGGQVEESITNEQPMTRAMLATVTIEPRAIVDHPLG